jgi:hypothetical protein
MPTKSGLSHGLAAFTSIILGTIISNYLSAHETVLTDVTKIAGGMIVHVLGLNHLRTVAGMLLISSILAFFGEWLIILPAIDRYEFSSG